MRTSLGNFKRAFGTRIKFTKKRSVIRPKPIQMKVLEWSKKIAIQMANQPIKKISFIDDEGYLKIEFCQQFKLIKFSVKISRISLTKKVTEN